MDAKRLNVKPWLLLGAGAGLALACLLGLPDKQDIGLATSMTKAKPMFSPTSLARQEAAPEISKTVTNSICSSAEPSPEMHVKSLTETLANEFAAIQSLPYGPERNRRMDALFKKWIHLNPNGAAEFVLSIPDEELRKTGLLGMMRSWTDINPVAALSWAQSAPFQNQHELEMAVDMACTQVAKKDPSTAIQLALDNYIDGHTDQLLAGLATRWAQTNLPAARQWVESLPEGIERDRMLESVALVLFDSNQSAAVQLILDQMPLGEEQNAAIVTMVSKMADQSPTAAQAWVDQFPAGRLHDQAVERVALLLKRQ